MNEFARALQKVLVHEGGYVNHPKDPGGATNQGVTQRVYDAYRVSIKQPKRSVREMTTPERDNIYRNRYWNLVRGEDLPPGVGYAVFDGAVNSGVSQSLKWLQRALGFTGNQVDGIIGSDTLTAVVNHPDHDILISKMIAIREKFLRALKTFSTFGRGWLARIAGVKAVGQAWAMGSVGPEIHYVPNGNMKALLSDAKSPPPKAVGDAATGGGGVSVLLSQATNELTPYSNFEFVAKAIAVITVTGAVVAILGFGYRTWATRRTKALAEALS